MPRPVDGNSYSYSDNPPPLTPAELNALGNTLWLSTYFLFNSGTPADSYTFQLAMKGIQAFMNQYPTAPTDDYLSKLWNDLTSSNRTYPESLVDLAQNYTSNGYNPNDLQTFNKLISDSSSFFNDFEYQINKWGSEEGGFTPNPDVKQKLERNFEELYSDFDSGASLSQFLSDVTAVEQDLNNNLTTPLDGVCQMLQNVLNTPLDPSNPNSTLATLAKNGDVNDLQTLLKNNPNFVTEFQGLLQKMASMENFPSSSK